MENNLFESRTDLSAITDSIAGIKKEVGQIIVGQEKLIDMLITALLAEGHVLLEGVPGVAKTLISKLLSRTLSISFSRIQFTPDMLPSDVLGTSIYKQGDNSFHFKKGPVFSNYVLIDEINRAPAKTQSALFEVMEERQITVDGITYPLTRPFMIMATQNPLEQEGTYRLPEAQLDRFMFKIDVGYPNLEEEIAIINGFQSRKGDVDLNAVKPLLTAEQLTEYQAMVRNVLIEEPLCRYIAQIVYATRNHASLYLGASPRASLAVVRASRAVALMNGRDFVVPDDIRFVLPEILSHRIVLSAEKEMEGMQARQVIDQIVKGIEVPK